MRKIIVFIILILVFIGIILFGIISYVRHEGSLDIIFIDNSPDRVLINEKEIIGTKNRYFTKTDYGPVFIQIYYKDENEPTLLKIFKENNWYKSKMEIRLNNNILEVKYIEDLTKIFEIEEISVEIGQEIIFSWL
ncbi:MAG: hypothetical protein LBI28_05920 [Treponema sp.]|jgi:hypothetical protein|nr:hypothetical protein [Treponema sp.]